MSQVLKGLLQPQIKKALSGFGTNTYSGPEDASAAQDKFATDLAEAIAIAVQQYLLTNVVTVVAAGPLPHIHNLQAP